MNKSLEYILAKFPDHRAQVLELYNNDEDFRMLCEDFLTSAKALEQYRQTTIKDRQFGNEYSQVFVDLEKEITHLLGSSEQTDQQM